MRSHAVPCRTCSPRSIRATCAASCAGEEATRTATRGAPGCAGAGGPGAPGGRRPHETAVRGRSGHRKPARLIPPHGVERPGAPVSRAQQEAGGVQSRAVLGLDQEAGSPTAEGLNGHIRVPQDDRLGAVAVGIGHREGGQETRSGGCAILVVVDDDEIGDRTPLGDPVRLPRAEGLDGAVLKPGRVHPAGLGPALGGRAPLGVPDAQQRRGRPPHGDGQDPPQLGQVIGAQTELAGAGQQVAQLGAEGPGGDGGGGQTRPLLGDDESRERRILLRPGQQDRGGQRVGAVRRTVRA